MKAINRRTNRYWGETPLPKSKSEFFNAITSPPQSGSEAVATIRLYGPVDSWGGYWGVSAKEFGLVLDALPDTVTEIILRLNSPGGEIFEGVSILNMLRAHKAKVTAVVDGLAASIASVIAAGCDETVMSPGTTMVIHSPWNIAIGNANDLREEANILDGLEKSLVEIYTAKAGEKDWTALLAAETWMTATDAVEAGLADRVAVVPDAGDTSTAGDEPVVLIEVVNDGAAEDSLSARITPIATRAAALAHMPPDSTEPVESNQKENVVAYDDLKAGLRDRLGVTDAEATDEALLAAFDQVIEQATDPAAAPAAAVPAGTQLIDSEVLAGLQADAAQGRAAREEQVSARRDGIIAKAMQEGRIAPAASTTWRAQLDANEEGTTALINSLAVNTIPVSELGTAPAEASADDAVYNTLFGADEKKGA